MFRKAHVIVGYSKTFVHITHLWEESHIDMGRTCQTAQTLKFRIQLGTLEL